MWDFCFLKSFFETVRYPIWICISKRIYLIINKDVLVLTEKSSKQLIEDRRDYGGMLQMKAEVAAQVMAQRMKKEIEKKKSEWDEKEEAEQQKKMDELCEASNETAVNLGAGVIGTNIDLSL